MLEVSLMYLSAAVASGAFGFMRDRKDESANIAKVLAIIFLAIFAVVFGLKVL